jgi:hypothetical protein
MLTKTKIALAAMIVAATSSVALAQEFDPNLANRYPAYANPVAAAPHGTFQSAPVRLLHSRNASLPTGRMMQGRNVALPTGQAAGTDWFEINRSDRASSPYAGGGF